MAYRVELVRRLFWLLWSVLSTALVPLYLLRLWRKSQQQPLYRQHWKRRLSWDLPPLSASSYVLVHAVSLGETRAAKPLIQGLIAAFPQHRVLITSSTATGYLAASELCALGCEHTWWPWDSPAAVRRFLQHYPLAAVVLVETELWPQLMKQATERQIPLYLAGARLSRASARAYARWGMLSSEWFGWFSRVDAGSSSDARRLRLLGAKSVHISGSLKHDADIEATQRELGLSWRQNFSPQAWLWVAVSTRAGEEKLLIEAFRRQPVGTMVLVPRHPERFDEVAQLLAASGLRWARKSCPPWPQQPEVLLGDSIGQMYAYCALAQAAFIGGSLVDTGGQNPLEAALSSLAVAMGPSRYNFATISAEGLRRGGLHAVNSATELMALLALWQADPAQLHQAQQAARTWAEHNSGASARIIEGLHETLSSRLIAGYSSKGRSKKD